MTDDPIRDSFLKRHRDAARHGRGPATMTRAALDAVDRRATLRRGVAIASMGNSAAAHSSSLAPDIADRIGTHVAVQVAARTGARYIGHVPHATDRFDGTAAWWSPACMPVDEFVAATLEYLRFVLGRVARPAELWLVSGHGGNAAIEPHLEDLARELGVGRCHYVSALRVPPGESLDLQHAGPLEHSVARALGPGCFDGQAHAILNLKLATDLEATLKDQPALGGMAGYYLYGDRRFDAVRERAPGVVRAVAELVERRSIPVDAEAGERVLAHSIAEIARELAESAAALARAEPKLAR